MNKSKYGIFGVLMVFLSILAVTPSVSAGDDNYNYGTICVHKFYDTNGDGVFNNGDFPIANWTVYVKGISPGITYLKETGQTDINGVKCFYDLPNGTYYAGEEKVPIGWKATTAPYYTVKINFIPLEFIPTTNFPTTNDVFIGNKYIFGVIA